MKHLRKLALLAIAFALILPIMFQQSVEANSPIRVLLDGKTLTFDQPPIIQNNRVMVPMRVIFEELGATVHWDSRTNGITATKTGTTVSLVINNSNARINGQVNQLDSPAIIRNGRTLVPIRFVSEALGASVQWDSTNRIVIINSDGSFSNVTGPSHTLNREEVINVFVNEFGFARLGPYSASLDTYNNKNITAWDVLITLNRVDDFEFLFKVWETEPGMPHSKEIKPSVRKALNMIIPNGVSSVMSAMDKAMNPSTPLSYSREFNTDGYKVRVFLTEYEARISIKK